MASDTKSDRHELANRLSCWSQLELGYEISPEVFLQMFHSPEMMEIWTHVVDNVKSITLSDSLYLKVEEIAHPASAELLSYHKRLLEKDSALDLEIENLQKEIQVSVGIISTNEERINKLKSEVLMHPSKMQIFKAHRLLLENNVQKIMRLISKIETALSELPRSTVSNYDSSQLTVDVQETLEMLSNYYQTSRGECANKVKHKVHNKMRQMAKLYRSEQYLEFLSSDVEAQKLQSDEKHSDIQMIKGIMESCLSDLQAAHRDSFVTTQMLYNKILKLESEKADLMKQLNEQLSCSGDADNLEELYEINMEMIQKKEIIKCLSDIEVPDGMPTSSQTNLLLVQKQIENQEEVLRNLRVQMAKVCHANKNLLDSFQTIEEEDSSCKPAIEYKDLRLNFISDNFHKKLEAVENWLMGLDTSEPDISDLCVRPGSRIINNRIKVELQSALDMPFYEAPEMIGNRLQNEMDNYWDNRNVSRILSHLLGSLDIENTKQNFFTLYKSVEDSNSKAIHVTKKANSFVGYINSLTCCQDLKQGLRDFQEQPAFNDNIL